MMVEFTILRSFLKRMSTAGIFLTLCLATSGQNAFRHWAAKSETQIGSGFDSNINGSRTRETKDGFATVSQSINLSRQNSLTLLDFTGNLSKTQFFSEREVDFLDGGIQINAAYPEDAVDVTYWKATAYANKVTQINLDAGRRIQPKMFGARIAGEWLFSPKTGIVGSLNANKTDRSGDGLSTTRALALRTGFSQAWKPERRWSAEYGLTVGDTDAGRGTDSVQHFLGVRRRGPLSPKLDGEAFVGVRRSEYSGSQKFSDSGPTVSADLMWAASPRFTARLGIDSDYDFSATGLAVLNTAATIRLKRELGKGLRLSGTIGRGHARYEQIVPSIKRSDDFWIVNGELEYAFTQRFFVRLTGDLIDSRSSVSGNDLNRSVVSLFSGWRY